MMDRYPVPTTEEHFILSKLLFLSMPWLPNLPKQHDKHGNDPHGGLLCASQCSKQFPYITSFNSDSEVNAIIMSVLQMRKLRHGRAN